MNSIQILLGNPLFALFIVIGAGLLLGSVKIKGLSLGSSGVLFTGLLCGHLGFTLPDIVGTIGLVLFVYCVGISAGGRFFGALAREGATLAKMAIVIVALGALVTWGCHTWMKIPVDLAVGIFAGALTSTPALAAGTEGLGDAGSNVIIGYGIAYPFGVIGVVLFVQLMPRLMRQDLDKEAEDYKQENEHYNSVLTSLVEVNNPNLYGKSISDVVTRVMGAVQISRKLEGERLVPLRYDDVFAEGQHLFVIGRQKDMDLAIDFLGHKSDRPFIKDVENQQRRLVVTNAAIVGLELQQLQALREYGVMISRVTRMDVTFVPTPDTRIQRRDLFTTVGNPEDLDRFAKAIGHRSQAFDETDLLSLSVGIALGVMVGMIPFALPGTEGITLGMAGGPLFVALLLGHVGKIGRVVGHIPRPTRQLLQELGLVFFLANAGVKGGASMVETLMKYGPILFLAGVLITLVPMVLTYVFAKRLFKVNNLQALGGICGGMTSTPALGALTARTDSQLPVLSYATAYPVALIVMTVFAKLLIAVMQ
ncbi:putative transport protein [Haloferula luteola]|uniref:Putative transport protein n=1 Tax=Haloferula luteola TaxID=595692 RepID=A0A840V2I9_9BACT|nr:aspartate:alanine exchanger family transporter [Haloferula luteola]MBB5352205.1 putative transport protein [Haloferula luteola]